MTISAEIKREFVAAWLCSFDLAAASKAVGIDIIAGTDLLADAEVKKLIEVGRAHLNDRVLISAANVLTNLQRIATADLSTVLTAISANDGLTVAEKLAGLPDAERYALKAITPTKFGLKVELADKTAALTLLGKALALWSDAVATVNVGTTAPEVRGALSDMTTQEKAEAFAAMVNSGPITH